MTGWPDEGRPVHADRPWPAVSRLIAVGLGAAALLGAVGLGAAGCLASAGTTRSTPTSASRITVTPAVDTAGKTP